MITYIKDDLFHSDKTLPLAHCIATDFGLCAGIALTFRRRYPDMIDALENTERPNVGELVIFNSKQEHVHKRIINLITKELSREKPRREDFNKTLDNLKLYLQSIGETQFAIPKIGAGIDNLDWEDTEKYLNDNFADFNIYVYYI